jgi:DNA polymerase III alpha subunit (gram-positive type)
MNLVMMMSDIEEIKKTPKQDKAEEKRVEFHLHSSMSQMVIMTKSRTNVSSSIRPCARTHLPTLKALK